MSSSSASSPPNDDTTNTSTTNTRSPLRDFLASIAAIPGDLSNITAPPFLLAPHSTTTLPRHWASDPSLLLAPAREEDPARRALAVLKWWLASLRGMNYGDVVVEDGSNRGGEGIKKPLNAFLGELFLARWSGKGEGSDDLDSSSNNGETRLVSEQVSHHPPVTACCLWNEKTGVRAEGYTAQEITFNGNVLVRQIGHAVLRLERWEEDYLIPLPDVKIKGLLTGSPYPEISGTYSVVGSGGFVGEVKFHGKGFLGGGTRNAFHAELYRHGERDKVLYSVDGQWSGTFTFKDEVAGVEVETYDTSTKIAAEMNLDEIDAQDPWESRRAWRDVIDALNSGDMGKASKAKSKLEQGQRDMRKDEKERGETWKPLFFQSENGDPVFDKLASMVGEDLHADRTMGVWKLDWEKVKTMQKPFHADLVPDNTHDHNTSRQDETLNGASVQQQSSSSLSSLPFQEKNSAQPLQEPNPSHDQSQARAEASTRDPSPPVPRDVVLPVDLEAQQHEINAIKQKQAAEAAEKEKIENFLRSRYSSAGSR